VGNPGGSIDFEKWRLRGRADAMCVADLTVERQLGRRVPSRVQVGKPAFAACSRTNDVIGNDALDLFPGMRPGWRDQRKRGCNERVIEHCEATGYVTIDLARSPV